MDWRDRTPLRMIRGGRPGRPPADNPLVGVEGVPPPPPPPPIFPPEVVRALRWLWALVVSVCIVLQMGTAGTAERMEVIRLLIHVIDVLEPRNMAPPGKTAEPEPQPQESSEVAGE